MALLRNELKDPDDEKLLFQLCFLRNDANQCVEVVEDQNIDFSKIRQHIELGESVVITRKARPKVSQHTGLIEDKNELFYVDHI